MTASEVRGTVLLVESDPDQRDLVASWLEEAGYDVTVCPGPTEPDYTCIGARTGACSLATGASVVILDMSLESEVLMVGTLRFGAAIADGSIAARSRFSVASP